jgi:hypothetical protein
MLTVTQQIKKLPTQNVEYHAQNRWPLVPILNHMNPVHTFPQYFPKIRFNITLLHPSLLSGLFLVKLLIKTLYTFPIFTRHTNGLPISSSFSWLSSFYLVKLFLIQPSSASCHFNPLTSNYSPQQHKGKHRWEKGTKSKEGRMEGREERMGAPISYPTRVGKWRKQGKSLQYFQYWNMPHWLHSCSAVQ